MSKALIDTVAAGLDLDWLATCIVHQPGIVIAVVVLHDTNVAAPGGHKPQTGRARQQRKMMHPETPTGGRSEGPFRATMHNGVANVELFEGSHLAKEENVAHSAAVVELQRVKVHGLR